MQNLNYCILSFLCVFPRSRPTSISNFHSTSYKSIQPWYTGIFNESRLLARRRGGVRNKVFIRGGSAQRFKPLPLDILILTKWYPFHIPKAKFHPFCIPQGSAKTTEFQYNHHVFLGCSVVLVHLLKGCKLLCVLVPFNILRFSHRFFHFAADLVTLSYT